LEQRQTNLCSSAQVAVPRLTIQSLSEQPLLVKNVIVNDNAECSANPLAKLAEGLKAEGRDPGLLGSVPATSTVSGTMKFGKVAAVPLFGCEPVLVQIVTDRGESVTTSGRPLPSLTTWDGARRDPPEREDEAYR
jgi:hypothetical protein